jgi:hypothetical protein
MKLALAIIGFVLLPRVVRAQAAKPYQLAENNVIIRFTEKREEFAAREILAITAPAKQELIEKYRLAWAAPIEIKLCATTYEFCQITGRPWWQVSICRGRVIYLQPVRILRERGILETTLRHEIAHALFDEHSKGHSPAWLSEALAIYNSGEIAFLKPARKKFSAEELVWSQLERRMEKMATKVDAERLYFQLYHLGQFLETAFTPARVAALLLQLGDNIPFDQACENILACNANELEQRWLQEATEKIK